MCTYVRTHVHSVRAVNATLHNYLLVVTNSEGEDETDRGQAVEDNDND